MIEDKDFLKEQLAFCKQDLKDIIDTKRSTAVYLILSLIAMVVANMFFAAGGFLFFLILFAQIITAGISARNTVYLGLALLTERAVTSEIIYYESALENLEGDKEEE